MKVGDLVKVSCSDNKFLDGKIGTLVLSDDKDGLVYGTCVMIDGAVYGFEKEEVKKILKTGAENS